MQPTKESRNALERLDYRHLIMLPADDLNRIPPNSYQSRLKDKNQQRGGRQVI